MIDELSLTHHIQKHIMSVLMQHKYSRFKDMRPAGCETNLYSYHLKLLVGQGFVAKTLNGYTLAKKGLLYADRVSTQTLHIRTQPKILSMLVIQNTKNQVLLYRRSHQPYADVWTLPYGKLHIDDASIHAAALREASEKLHIQNIALRHAGDCYIRVVDQGEIITSTLAHVFLGHTDQPLTVDNILWTRPDELPTLPLAPAVQQIVSQTLSSDGYFFKEYVCDWQ